MKIIRTIGSVFCVILVMLSILLFPTMVFAKHVGSMMQEEKLTAAVDTAMKDPAVQKDFADFLVSSLLTNGQTPLTQALSAMSTEEKGQFVTDIAAMPSLHQAIHILVVAAAKEVFHGYQDGFLDFGPVLVTTMEQNPDAIKKVIYDLMVLYMQNPTTRMAMAKSVTEQGFFSKVDDATLSSVMENENVQKYIADIATYTTFYALSGGKAEPMNIAKAYGDLFSQNADAMAPVAASFLQGKDKTQVIIALNLAGAVKGLKPISTTASDSAVLAYLITVFEDEINKDSKKDLDAAAKTSPAIALQDVKTELTPENQQTISTVLESVSATQQTVYTVSLVAIFIGMYALMSLFVLSIRRSLVFVGASSIGSGIFLGILSLIRFGTENLTVTGDETVAFLARLVVTMLTTLSGPLLVSAAISLVIGVVCIILFAVTKRKPKLKLA